MLIAKHTGFAAASAADDQVVPAVAVHVEPTHARPRLAEFVRQGGLPDKIVEGVFDVAMRKRGSHVLEQWRWDRSLLRRRFDGGGFFDGVQAVGRGVLDERPPSAAPRDLDP